MGDEAVIGVAFVAGAGIATVVSTNGIVCCAAWQRTREGTGTGRRLGVGASVTWRVAICCSCLLGTDARFARAGCGPCRWLRRRTALAFLTNLRRIEVFSSPSCIGRTVQPETWTNASSNPSGRSVRMCSSEPFFSHLISNMAFLSNHCPIRQRILPRALGVEEGGVTNTVDTLSRDAS